LLARRHYYGSAVLRDDDLIGGPELSRQTASRAWTINMRSGGWGERFVPVPSHWTKTAEWVFPEVYRVQGDVVVAEYSIAAQSVENGAQ
jgi:hypothetical protein